MSLAQEAGKIILRSSKEIDTVKGIGNFATKADLESEKFVMEEILKKFPGHAIFSEETRNKIRKPEDIASLWIIDPIDGTTNFFYGIPFFAVSIAYAEFGKVTAGAIYDPVRRELFCARAGGGAYLDSERLKMRSIGKFSGTLANIGSPYKKANFEKIYPLSLELNRRGARIRNYGASVLEAAYVAAGRLAFYADWGPKTWDVAAAKLIVEEAGGTVEVFGGNTIFNAQGYMFGPEKLVARAKKSVKWPTR